MTTQQTSLSLADLISTLRTLTSGEKKKENKVAVPNSFDDIGTNARLKIKDLRQNKKHVDEYITEFCLLAIDTEYDDRALIDHFLKGLHPALLKTCLLQPDQPDTIEGWYDRAKKYNNTWLTMMAITEGEKAKKSPKTETKVNRISDEEAQEYRRKGLCYKCSKPGHIAKNCQEKPKNDPKKENQKKSTPEDAYHKIRAIYRDFSEEEQTQILDLMEGGGF
ncbi:hypothetical protein WG66_000407 [Moniliophthora roreri]|nr:hypothetical protein WG66_000407 [Moniliophthora roreri]